MPGRPVSIDDLIGNKSSSISQTPKFLTKKQRRKLAEERKENERMQEESKVKEKKINNKRPAIQIHDHEIEDGIATKKAKTSSSVPKFTNNFQSSKNKFNFEWKLDDDTSTDYQPLVTYDTNPDHSRSSDDINDTHWSEKKLENMTQRDWRIFREDYNISSKGGEIANPLRSWKESSISARLIDLLATKFGYDDPTPIQRATIPIALSQRDVVGIAETGSGKTLAFLIPLLTYILSIESNYKTYEHKKEINLNKPFALVLAPTRELALQISKEATKFCDELGLSVVTIIGGHQYEETIHSLRNGVHIVVATPGRLIDSVERALINLDDCHYLVMDEADKMIDMGFEKSLQSIMSFLPPSDRVDHHIFKLKKRVTLMFTATMSPPIEKITKNYLINPGYLFIGNVGEAIDNIDQKFEYINAPSTSATPISASEELDPQKTSKLLTFLKAHTHHTREYSIIIFANYKKICEQLARFLDDKGYRDSVVIHGSKSQEFRERAIESFRSHKANILIATDIAARGIDVPNVSLVINYQMSKKFDEYIHRIGRTGRAGNKGVSYTILDEQDSEVFPDLKRFLSKGRKKCPDWLLRHDSNRIQYLRD